LLHEAADALGLSARGFHRTLRVARTLADLDGENRVARIHIARSLELSRRDVAARARRGLSLSQVPGSPRR
jgi:magnesium chelatase family protein